jgi:recombinational DNA repair protein (RecF pathway)
LYRYGEADCIVKLFTRRAGRMSAFYKKGFMAHKNHSALVALAQARIGHVALSEERMGRLYSVDPDPRCLAFGASLKLFAYSSYIAELIEKLIPEHEVIEPIFELLTQTHEALLLHNAQSYILRALELKLLDILGYLPEICFYDTQAALFYDPLSCAFVSNASPKSFAVSTSALSTALAMLKNPVGSIEVHEKEELLMIGRIFHSRLKLLGLLPLKSLAFFKQIAV